MSDDVPTSLVILPLEGEPYILDGDKSYNTQRSNVGGNIECVDPTAMRIMSFGSKRWAAANALLVVATNVWVNGEGVFECSPNMLTLNKFNNQPFFGRIAIEVPNEHLTQAMKELLTTKALGK